MVVRVEILTGPAPISELNLSHCGSKAAAMLNSRPLYNFRQEAVILNCWWFSSRDHKPAVIFFVFDGRNERERKKSLTPPIRIKKNTAGLLDWLKVCDVVLVKVGLEEKSVTILASHLGLPMWKLNLQISNNLYHAQEELMHWCLTWKLQAYIVFELHQKCFGWGRIWTKPHKPELRRDGFILIA